MSYTTAPHIPLASTGGNRSPLEANRRGESDLTKSRPILFSAPMVRAVLDGSKTQTRRIAKPRKSPSLFDMDCEGCPEWADSFILDPANREWLMQDNIYGQPGDRLIVKEAFTVQQVDTFHTTAGKYLHTCIDFAADGVRTWVRNLESETPKILRAVKYRKDGSRAIQPAIFLPLNASRLTLEITAVRPERLQDISQADAIAEGIQPLLDAATRGRLPECDLNPMPWVNYLWHGHVGKTITDKQSQAWPHQFSSYTDPRGSYASLWESINGPQSWAANPWVWVIEFKVLQP